jgi:mannose-1-phosphate guanylyltransferase
MNIVLMAGGGGTRLWPVSRRSSPKQFFKLQGNITLLEQAYERAARVVSPANIFLATLEEYKTQTEKLVPKIPKSNRFYEPSRRDTAAAFAAVNLQLKLRGQGDTPAIFLWSDHIFTSEQDFVEDIRKIPELINRYPDSIVMVGHVPAFPETGFGYIEAGVPIAGFDDVFQVKSFKEKPKLPTAKKFLAAGNFFWGLI